MKRVLLGIFAATTLAITGIYAVYVSWTPQTAPQQTVVTKPAVVIPDPPTPEELLRLVNEERAKAGVSPLKIDPNVQKSAQLKADDFAERNYYDHIVKGTKYTLTEEMVMYVNKSCVSSSENIAHALLPSKGLVDGWMDSKPHREAILSSKYTLTGFGIAKADNGWHYAVQHFCVAK